MTVTIIAGDWNTDIQRPCSFTHTVSAFLGELNQSLVDPISDNVSFTYSSHGGFISWLDHVAISTSFSSVVTSVRSILDGRNLSDHNPLAFSLNLSAIVVDCSCRVYKPTSISWSKATSKDICQCQSIVAHSLVSLGSMLSDDIVLCCNPLCTSHQTLLDEMSYELVTCLKSAADLTVPSAGTGRHSRVAGWSQFVKPELTASQWWHKLWVDAGSPSAGVLFQLMLIGGTNMLFIESGEKRSISSEQGLLKLCSVIQIATFGLKCVGLLAIINLFLHLFLMVSLVQKILLTCGAVTSNSSTILLMAQLPQTCCACALDSGISHDVLYQTSISAEVIDVAIGKSKRGKSDGDTLMSDHIIEAPSSHCQFLARLFTSMLRHGFMPSSFRDATIQPIPKGSKNPSLSANYRGIALASSLSKVMEWSIFLTWESFLTTSDLQFGFKSGFSTTLCTGVLKAVINCHLNNGSKVYVCLKDASKAFDLVDHRILFDKVLERGMPKPVVRLLLR